MAHGSGLGTRATRYGSLFVKSAGEFQVKVTETNETVSVTRKAGRVWSQALERAESYEKI